MLNKQYCLSKLIRSMIDEEDVSVYLMKNERKMIYTMNMMFQTSRLNQIYFAISQLFLSVHVQQGKNQFYEKSISELTHDVITLRGELSILRKKTPNYRENLKR